MASSLLQEVEISASQFLDIFHHYDNDGNGFIEGKELQSFIKELREARQQAGLVSQLFTCSVRLYLRTELCLLSGRPDASLKGLTDHMRQFVSENEETSDRRIGLVELVQILPTEENFLLFFRQQLSSASQFLQTWRRYDADHSGYIEADELKNFLKDLLLKNQRTFDLNKLDEYTAATLKIFDSNGDGKLCLAEMARLLPDDENFLLRFEGVKMSRRQFNRIFDLYDQDGSGFMDEEELDVLLRDLCENNKKV
ncbi:hypothetical protein PAMA_015714 [Pampus argenteus]